MCCSLRECSLSWTRVLSACSGVWGCSSVAVASSVMLGDAVAAKPMRNCPCFDLDVKKEEGKVVTSGHSVLKDVMVMQSLFSMGNGRKSTDPKIFGQVEFERSDVLGIMATIGQNH